jgi:hypothetical protein
MQSFGSFHTFLAGRMTLLRAACLTEAVIGNGADGPSCFFMANGTTGAAKPNNGIIPSRSFGVAEPLHMVDLEATAEAGSVEQTIMGDLPDLLARSVNAQIDRAIVSALDGCDGALTVDSSGSALDVMMKSDVKLGNNEVPVEDEDNMFALITPIMRAKLLKQTEFSSGDYVNVKGFSNHYGVWRWAGKNWLVAPELKHSYLLHRLALGHALDLAALAVPGAVTGGIDAATGVGWMKAKTKHLATVLQPQGVVRIVNDGSAQ